MKLLCTITFLLLSPYLSEAQQRKFERPDYKLIQQQTSDKGSPYYYPFLFNRYLEFDTALKLEDFRALYYGHFYHDNSESKTLPLRDSVRKYYNRDTLLPGDYVKLIGWTKKIAGESPFDLEQMNNLRKYYSKTGDTTLSNKYYRRIQRLVNTILSTGDGLTHETSIHVTAVSHEYFIMGRVFGVHSKSQHLTDLCDYHELEPNAEKLAGLYFNVEQIFEGYNKMFEDVKLTLPDDEDTKKKK